MYSVGITETKLKKWDAVIQMRSFEKVFLKIGKTLKKDCEKAVKLQPVNMQIY